MFFLPLLQDVSSLKVPHVLSHIFTHSGKQWPHGVQCWDRRMLRYTHFHSLCTHTHRNLLLASQPPVFRCCISRQRALIGQPKLSLPLIGLSDFFFRRTRSEVAPPLFFLYSSSYAYYINQYGAWVASQTAG